MQCPLVPFQRQHIRGICWGKAVFQPNKYELFWRKIAANQRKIPAFLTNTGAMARREGFEPRAFWSVATLRSSVQTFQVVSGPIASGILSFLALFRPLAPLGLFLFWVKLWVRRLEWPRRRISKKEYPVPVYSTPQIHQWRHMSGHRNFGCP